MIRRQHRFHGLHALAFAYKNGKTIRGKEISLRYVLNTRQSQWRAAVVVSKKVHKSAVVRNRLRRQMYEVIRMSPQPTANYDLIFTIHSPDAQPPEAVDLLLRAGVITKM